MPYINMIHHRYTRVPHPEPSSSKEMVTHSSVLAWRIPGTGEPGGLQTMGSLRVRHDWGTLLSLSLSCIGEGNGNPLQCSCLENPRDRGTWWAAVFGIAQNRARLKRLSSSSSSRTYDTYLIINLKIMDPFLLESFMISVILFQWLFKVFFFLGS